MAGSRGSDTRVGPEFVIIGLTAIEHKALSLSKLLDPL